MGRKLSEEHKRKIGESNKGRSTWATGKKFSDEHRRRISEGRKKMFEKNKELKEKMRLKTLDRIEKGEIKIFEKGNQLRKGKTPWNKGKKYTEIGYDNIGFKHGEDNHMWQGDDVGYHALHDWVRRQKGKPTVCVDCGATKSIEWANKSGEYLREESDWISLCTTCHRAQDKKIGIGKIKKKYGKIY